MKLTLREKTLLLILALTLIFAASYFLLIKPELDNIALLVKENADYRKQVEEVKKDIASENKLEADINALNLMVEDEAGSFFPAILQDKIIVTLEQITSKTSVKAGAYKFGGITVGPVRQNTAKAAAEDIFVIKEFADQYNSMLSKAPQKGDAVTVKRPVYQAESLPVSFELQGSYWQLMSFVKALEELDRAVVIKSFAIAATGQDQLLKGSMQADFYALPKLGGQDEKYFDWSVIDSYGKDNPFTK